MTKEDTLPKQVKGNNVLVIFMKVQEGKRKKNNFFNF